MNSSNFETWFAKQLVEGLTDIKLAIVPGKDISNEAVRKELLAAEAAIASGFLRSPPRATSVVAESIEKIVRAVRLEHAKV